MPGPLPLLFTMLLGAFGWTLAEYLLHRFAAHAARGRNHFSREHLRHHGTPSYFAPAVQKALSALVAVPVVGAVVALPFGLAIGLAFALGFAVSYLGYEYLHWRIHIAPPRGRWSRAVRLHHLHHHFGDPRSNHGVTTTLWDRAFGTYVPVARVAVPRKRALPWMINKNGGLHAELAGDYEVTDRPMARA